MVKGSLKLPSMLVLPTKQVRPGNG